MTKNKSLEWVNPQSINAGYESNNTKPKIYYTIIGDTHAKTIETQRNQRK